MLLQGELKDGFAWKNLVGLSLAKMSFLRHFLNSKKYLKLFLGTYFKCMMVDGANVNFSLVN